ncbi:MAG: hypothetical protein IH820_18205 [Bacteroidetes bacterium]|nr:hypothetical protein [Bacteroidota bacterium]
MTKQAFIYLFLFLFMGVAWTGCYGCFGSSDDESTVVVDDDDDDGDDDDDDGDDDDDDDGDDDDDDDGEEAPENLAEVLEQAGEAIEEALGGAGSTVKEAVDFGARFASDAKFIHPLSQTGNAPNNIKNQPEFHYLTFEQFIRDKNISQRMWPLNPRSYLIIMAGPDKLYGTVDDIKNF